MYDLSRKLGAEFVGTAFLLATVVGSGIMAETLSGGNVAVALLGNTIPTGAILFVLITVFGPISGAHFNPAVTLAMRIAGAIGTRDALVYTLVQIAGAIFGVWVAHLMFGLDVVQFSQKARTGGSQWFAEFVATFGLVTIIFLTVRFRESAVAISVGLYITAAYWFTASTSFANPAVTIARGLSDTFAGIRPADVIPFIAVQLVAAVVATLYVRWQAPEDKS